VILVVELSKICKNISIVFNFLEGANVWNMN